MKKISTIELMLIGLTWSTFAEHNSPSTSAGGNMSGTSGHLTKSLPARWKK